MIFIRYCLLCKFERDNPVKKNKIKTTSREIKRCSFRVSTFRDTLKSNMSEHNYSHCVSVRTLNFPHHPSYTHHVSQLYVTAIGNTDPIFSML